MQEKRIKLVDLCQQIKQVMLELGYGQDSIRRYQRVWMQLQKFSKVEFYSPKICADFLSQKYQIDRLDAVGKFSKKQMYYLRAIRVLADYENFGTFFRRKNIKIDITWPKEFCEPLEAYINQMIANGLSSTHIRRNKIELKDLVLYLDKISVSSFNNIKPDHLSRYISSLVGYAPKTIATKISIYRCFFNYLYINEYIRYPLAEALPKVHSCVRTSLPTVWSKEEIDKIMNVIDRGNPVGKRDYAIILLIARLGLRVGDVRDLQLTDINWNTNQIDITQNKTKNPLSLPLLSDVGWAIIDYLKNGRPVTATKNVFIRHLAPFLPFSDSDNLHHIISKYITRAGIPIKGKTKIGMHSLRHSLATELMQHNIELPMISEILGHSDIETTRQYLSVNLPALRQCALNVEVLTNESA